MFVKRFDEKKYENTLREEGRESGLKEGRESGLKEGRESGLKEGRESGLKANKRILSYSFNGSKRKDGRWSSNKINYSI